MANLASFVPALRYGHELSLSNLQGRGLFTFGNTYFVQSTTGSDTTNTGTQFQPFATVAKAISMCKANNGDYIIVLPGHAETVTSTSINLSTAGVTVLGLGQGTNRPTFTFGAAAATITVSAANCRWTNTKLVANFADVAAAFTVGAAKDFVADNNEFTETSSSLNFLSAVVTGATNNAADGLTVLNNYFLGQAATENAFVSVLGNLDRINLQSNHVVKAATNNAGQFVTLSSKIILGAQIGYNRLAVTGATGTTVGIFLTGSGTTSTGFVFNNYVSSLDTTSELIATAGTGLTYVENYYTGTPDASAKLWPVVDAA